MQELILYHRVGCHLCDDMRAALLEFQADPAFCLREIDVDSDPALHARYGLMIPVLCLGEHEICHYFLDPTALTAALAGFPESG